ncbi:MAG: IS630 family transposase [Paracoccaceae bacterium]|nr:IS630 family transposase [Paracoccaceae bacterium]
MRKNDGRKLDHETLEAIRIRAVERVEAGESPEVVIQALGMSRARIYEWLAAYREGGYEALKAKKLFGRPPKLTGKDLDQLYRIVTTKNPMQLKFFYALWTRSMVREVIRDKFGVRLSDVSVGRLLRKLGLSAQKPLRRAYQQDPEAVDRWVKEEYPQIRKLAKREKAQIFFADEASVRSDYHSGTTWAPRGETPVVPSTGARFSLNLVSAVSPRGEMRFMTVDGRMNAAKFIEFLQRLMKGAENPIFLIVDGHPTHRALKVRKFIASTQGKLRLFFLPPYSPELNPDESVWNYVKNHHVGKATITGPDQFRALVLGTLWRMQRMPALIRSFFGQRELHYITA